MSHNLLNSTARSALILGMTNTDQVAFWQARAPAALRQPEPEQLPDIDESGNDAGGGDGGEVDPNTGLTPQEQADFDAMRTGDPAPGPEGGDDSAGDNLDDDQGGDHDDPADPPEPAQPAAAARAPKTAAELAAEAAAGQKPPGTPKTVSYGRYQRELKESREREAAAVETAKKAREDQIKLAERVAIINEALQARAADPAQPDPNAPPANPFDEENVDPEVDYAESVRQIQRRQAYQMEHQGRVEQTVAATREDTAMRDTFTRDFQSVAAQPEYSYLPQAYQFLKDARLTQIILAEFDKDPNDPNEVFSPQEVQQAVAIFNAEEKWLVGTAIKNRKSPAHAILKQARVYGFRPPAAEPAPAAAPAALGVPARRAAAAPAPAAPSATAELAALREAQAAGRSLSDGGGAPPQGLSAELLLKMDDDEFAEMIDQMSPTQLNAIMGKGPG